MHPAFALFAPNCQIHRRKGQTCPDVYRPDEGDPTHRIMAGYSEVLFVSWIAHLTEGHLRFGKPSRKCKSLDLGVIFIIPPFVKNPPNLPNFDPFREKMANGSSLYPRQSKKNCARDSASTKKRSLDFHRDLLSVSFAWYSATMRCNSRRTKLERLRSCLAASSSIASKISLGTLLIVSI